MDLLEVDYKQPQRMVTDPIEYADFPKRYPHWKWGEEYEILERPEKIPNRIIKIADRMINPNPVIVFCLDGKTWTEPLNQK